MSDARIQHLERRYKQTGDPAAGHAWARALVQTGRVNEVPLGLLGTLKPQAVAPHLPPAVERAALDRLLNMTFKRAEHADENRRGPTSIHTQRPDCEFVAWARAWIALLMIRDSMDAKSTQDALDAVEDHIQELCGATSDTELQRAVWLLTTAMWG